MEELLMNAAQAVAETLGKYYPHLTEAECTALAAGIDKIVEAGRTGQWDMRKVILMTKGGKPSTPLGTALRELREECGLTQLQVARACEWSLAKAIRIEGGTVGVSVSDVRRLVEVFDVKDQKTVDMLLDLARRGRR
jgi:DNA-binding XRE family transcriptional regulator